MNSQAISSFIEHKWEESIIPTLIDYIKIPNKSPTYDPDWQMNGYMDQAVALFDAWCKEQTITNMRVEIIQHDNRTPVLFIEIPGQLDQTVLLYGHLDKQPEMAGWADDLGPWLPVRKNDRLYGRGSADDGYALFCSLTAIMALQQNNIPHARCIVLIEACEESGSYDLPFYIEQLKGRIGEPELIICLDSGCGNYDQLWSTTSLRGVVNGSLRVDVLKEGVHSGNASGIVPAPGRIARELLSRLEDETTGHIVLKELHTKIPNQRLEQAKQAADILNDHVYAEFPFLPGIKPITLDRTDLILNRTWRPTLVVTGAAGLPALELAGNVLLPYIELKLSLRLPPNLDADAAMQVIKKTLEANPPYAATVQFTPEAAGQGWDAPELAPWLATATDEASQLYYGKPAAYMGEGGSIPFMGMLGQKFPQAQFLITGVLGPQSNAHGPNEFLHLAYAKKLTACVAHVLASHHQQIKEK